MCYVLDIVAGEHALAGAVVDAEAFSELLVLVAESHPRRHVVQERLQPDTLRCGTTERKTYSLAQPTAITGTAEHNHWDNRMQSSGQPNTIIGTIMSNHWDK